MTHWWRAYNNSIDHPKLLKLSDAMHRAWYTLQCVASENGGSLPATEDIAARLRMKQAKVAEWITKLVHAKLIDNDGGVFSPHNWDTRQYISDVTDPTAPERMKRYRKKKRNDRNAAVTDTVTVIRPETEQIQTTETEQKDSEPIGSGADAPRDHRAELFNRGLQTLARLTGKGPDACRSFVGKCLKAASDDAVTVLGLIEDAERNRVVDPSAWIVAGLKATGPPALRPLTEFQRGRNETKEILNDLGNYATGGGGGEENSRVLRGDTGERSEGIRGGAGADVIDLPAIGHRSSG